MIVQTCLNGRRAGAFHPALPLNTDAMGRDAAACVAAGAAEVHLHARGADGRESLDCQVMDATVRAMRKRARGRCSACPQVNGSRGTSIALSPALKAGASGQTMPRSISPRRGRQQ